MSKIKKAIKYLFYKTNTLSILDKFNYYTSRIKNRQKNAAFIKNNPGFRLPPDYFLYETYTLNYQLYKEDGAITAKEILAWTQPYLPAPANILEWGCGVARVIRHIPELLPGNSNVTGADINTEMIEWNAANIPGIQFKTIDYVPPTDFQDKQFDLVFALSVFTHIEATQQQGWIKEMHRLLSDKGVFLFTTHGKKFESNLNHKDSLALQTKGVVTKSYHQKGHRMMATYNTYPHFHQMILPYFTVLEYYDGIEHPGKTGGQDLWIVQKK